MELTQIFENYFLFEEIKLLTVRRHLIFFHIFEFNFFLCIFVFPIRTVAQKMSHFIFEYKKKYKEIMILTYVSENHFLFSGEALKFCIRA